MTPLDFAQRIYLITRKRFDTFDDGATYTYLGCEIVADYQQYQITLDTGTVRVLHGGGSKIHNGWAWGIEPTDYQMAELALIL